MMSLERLESFDPGGVSREEQLSRNMLRIMAESDDNGWQAGRGDLLRLRSGQALHPVFWAVL